MSPRIEIERALRHLAPRIPPHECGAVLDHAMGSSGLHNASPENAAWLSLVTYIRHVFTDYDELLSAGYDVDSARHFVAAEIDVVLKQWDAKRKLNLEE
ncbi:MAG TPA: DUF2293 domain-containing protein [Xanthobacteraceae bacterium]|jgi:hypothetical protein|nr:DUF2293 domain-containing protein [Xanthobacteraceae bacterium]